MKRAIFFLIAKFIQYILTLRHHLYDIDVLKSRKVENVFTIVVGNLALGGTGKTPFTIFLANHLSGKYKVAIMSRGYGRKTSGFLKIEDTHTANEVGDEPLLMKTNTDVAVYVCEDRVRGLNNIKGEYDVVILDDAFQHRRLKANFNILLSKYSKPFYGDELFPYGNLRDLRNRAFYTDKIVMTKCPEDLSIEQKNAIYSNVAKYSESPVDFSSIAYSSSINSKEKYLLVTGIANSDELIADLDNKKVQYVHKAYKDHKVYEQNDIDQLIAQCRESDVKLILTTEKDYMKLKEFESKLKDKGISIVPIPITMEIVENKDDFIQSIVVAIEKFHN